MKPPHIEYWKFFKNIFFSFREVKVIKAHPAKLSIVFFFVSWYSSSSSLYLSSFCLFKSPKTSSVFLQWKHKKLYLELKYFLLSPSKLRSLFISSWSSSYFIFVIFWEISSIFCSNFLYLSSFGHNVML